MKRAIIVLGIANVLALAFLGSTLMPNPPLAASIPEAAEPAIEAAASVLATLNADEHDVLIYAARADLALGEAGYPGATAATGAARLDALWESRYVDGKGRPGFGLPVATDAFQDGSISPADTIYTYTSSMAALAFLDGYELGRDPVQLQRARATIDTILAPEMWGPTRTLWYSNHPNDRRVVWNVNALALAAVARFNRLAGSDRYEVEEAALAAAVNQAQAPDGSWPYEVGRDAPNDLLHHAFMVTGVVEARTPGAEAAIDHLRSFYGSDGSFDRSSAEVMGTKGWGPAEGLSALVLAEAAEAQHVARSVAAMVDYSGRVEGVAEQRAAARYALALAQHAASGGTR